MSDSSVFCGQCGTETFVGARFCMRCGSAMPAGQILPQAPPKPAAVPPRKPLASKPQVKPRVPTLTDAKSVEPTVSDSWPVPPDPQPAVSPVPADPQPAAGLPVSPDPQPAASPPVPTDPQPAAGQARPAGMDDSPPKAHGEAEGKLEQTMNNEPKPNERRTIIEEGTLFRGSLSSSCAVDVRGRIDGEIETPALTVSATGAVHGQVKVGSVRSEGELSGDFDADTVELAGVVKNNTIIRARTMEVKLSAERGKLQVIFGEAEQPTENTLATPGGAEIPGIEPTPTGMDPIGLASSDYDPLKGRRKRRNGEPERPDGSRGSRHSEPPPAAG
jgi:cytoskeletal protein CcmA (bactofilin family)